MNWTEVIPLVVAVIGAATGLLALLKGRSKEKADVAKALTEAAGELVEDYQRRLDSIEETIAEQTEKIRCQELKIDMQAEKIRKQGVTIEEQAKRIRALELERDEILNGVLALCTQIHELGQQPVWKPEAPNNNN